MKKGLMAEAGNDLWAFGHPSQVSMETKLLLPGATIPPLPKAITETLHRHPV